MKHLNNQQIILLAVLVSFVTSTATGIFTVALLSETPEGVNNTINRIVERTVQVVTQPGIERVIEKREEKTIEQGSKIVQEVIEKGTPSVVVFGTKKDEAASNVLSEESDLFVEKGVGVFIASTGKILTLSSAVDERLNYYILSKTGTSTQTTILLPLSIEKNDSSANLARFAISSPKVPALTVMPVSKKTLSIGQTVVVWGSQGVSVSFISSSQEGKTGTTYRIYADSTDPLPGRVVSNIDGELIGLLQKDNILVPASTVAAFLLADAQAGS